MIAIVRRIDADADQRVSFDEFCEAFTPVRLQDSALKRNYSSGRYEEPQVRISTQKSLNPERSSPLRSNSGKKAVRFEDEF